MLLHPGTQHSFNLAKELSIRGILYKFYTGFAYAEKSIFFRLSSFFPFLNKRRINGVQSNEIVTFPLLEFVFFLFLKAGVDSEKFLNIKYKIFQRVISEQIILKADIVIGFDTNSWIISRKCKKLGKPFILDASIGHPVPKNEIFEKLLLEFPQWSREIPVKKIKYINFEEEEIANANYISVPSSFVEKTYLTMQVPNEKIIKNPFGTDLSFFTEKNYQMVEKNKIRFLFFGSLNARKGLPFLLKAWEMHFQNIGCELIIAGFGTIPTGIILPKNVINLGIIQKQNRAKLFQIVDVFVFPSYYEGFAQVLIEAAASGLPIISTFNSGAEEIVNDGENGFIIDAGDEDKLKSSILFFILNPDQISQMGSLSRKKSEEFTWKNYGDRWHKNLISIHDRTVNMKN